MTTAAPYSLRFQLPDFLEQGVDNTLTAPVYRDGALVAPTAGVVSVYDASNTAIVSSAAASIVSSVAQYTVSAATLAGLERGEGWRVEWSLTVAGATVTGRNDAALCLRSLHPVVSDVDLYRLHPDLNPSATGALWTAGSHAQEFLDEAWVQIQLWLVAAGNRPNLIMTPSSLRQLHLYMTLELIFRHFATYAGQDGKYAELAEQYAQRADGERGRVNFLYDADDDGEADSTSRRRAGGPTLWLNGRF